MELFNIALPLFGRISIGPGFPLRLPKEFVKFLEFLRVSLARNWVTVRPLAESLI